MFSCFFCKQTFQIIHLLFLHIKFNHSLANCALIKCDQNGCPQTFTNLKSLKKHLNRCHNEQENEAAPIEVEKFNQYEKYSEAHGFVLESFSDNCPQKEDSVPFKDNKSHLCLDSLKTSIQDVVLKFVCKLNSHSHMTNKQIELIIEDVADIISSTINVIKDLCENHSKSSLMSFLDFSDKLFEKINTEHKLISTLLSKNLMEQPQEFVFNNAVAPVMQKGKPSLRGRKDKGTLLPIKFQIKKYFEQPKILDNTITYMENLTKDYHQNNVLENFIQGPYWRSLKNNFGNKIVIPYFLNYDDFETNNPIGSHTGSQSISGFYYSFPSTPPMRRSKLSYIFPAMFVKASHLKQFDVNNVLFELIEVLKSLEIDGIDINTNGGPQKVYFVLGMVLGDNLGVNSLLGFSKSFSHTYFCRICIEKIAETRTSIIENKALLRNIEMYSDHVQQNNYLQTGVRFDSVFNTIPSFHVTKSLSVDLMHDAFEGIVKYGLVNSIKYFITEKYFNLDTLNYRIQNFDYGEIEVCNRPHEIRPQHIKNNKIHVTAREAYTLLHFLTCFVGDLVPQCNKVWKYVCVLEELVNMLLLDNYSETDIILVENLISEHHKLYKKLFNDTLKPKHHMIVHYPSVIRMCGPVKHFWCMRYESKNKEIITYTKATASRRNLPLSTAKKCSMKFAYAMLSLKPDEEYIIKKQDNNNLENKTYCDYFKTLNFASFSIASEIIFQGTSFKTGFFVFKDKCLYKILDIIVSDLCFFMLQEIEISSRNEHFMCFFVKKPTNNIGCYEIKKKIFISLYKFTL